MGLVFSSPLPLASKPSGTLFIGIHVTGLQLGVTSTHSSTFIVSSGSLLWGYLCILALLLPSRRIRLRDSLLGVPGEINNIVSIVIRSLKVGDIEKSIKEVQPKRDAVMRASAELNKILARRPNLSIYDLQEIYRSFQDWLNIDEIGMLRALLKSGRKDLAELWREAVLRKR